jgi:enoyl-CoA hydratase/carnithine racemase
MSDNEHPPIDISVDGPVTTISMVYEPYNLVGPTLLNPLLAAIESAAANGARAIVVRSGLRHFSAGADLALFDGSGPGLAASTDTAPDGDVGDTEAMIPPAVVLDRLARVPLPIVASVHGACLGGGFELALACDYIVAARSAKIGSVEATLGLHPLMGAVQRVVQRAGEARAKEMAMLARRYDPETLERWNVINLVVDDDDLATATATVAAELGNGPTIAHHATKQLVRVAVDRGVRAADDEMAEIQQAIWRSDDLRTGLRSFMENGPGSAKFEGR